MVIKSSRMRGGELSVFKVLVEYLELKKGNLQKQGTDGTVIYKMDQKGMGCRT
jgi:hypothetical protein